MKFGLFGSAKAVRGDVDIDSSSGYKEWLNYNVEAESLGFYSSFTVEHHFTGFGQVSASLNLLTYLSALTTSMRLGTAVMTLPWHNPVLLAEQAATLDLLSEGRLDFGVGKGYRFNEFNSFGISMDEAEPRFLESIQIMKKSWLNDERWSYEGKFWQFNDIIVEPPCAQKPHPPLWLAAGHPASIVTVANMGANLLLDQFSPTKSVLERVQTFREAQQNYNSNKVNGEIALARALYIAKNEEDKMNAIEKRMNARARVDALSQRPDGKNKASIMIHKGADEALLGALIGTVDEIVERLHQLKDGGISYILLVDAGGGIEGLRKFAKDIEPQIN